MELKQTISARGHSFSLGGQFEPDYQPVVDAFLENFRVEDEVGAACSVIVEGKTVVDIWGGWRTGAMDDPWYLAEPIALEATTRVDAIVGFRLVGTNLSASFLNVTGAENRLTAGSMDHGLEVRWRLNWVFHF